MIEIGQKLGYLPGPVDEKMGPYTRYINDLVLKLHKHRTAKIFLNDGAYPPAL
jgi:PhoH-like ATPase